MNRSGSSPTFIKQPPLPLFCINILLSKYFLIVHLFIYCSLIYAHLSLIKTIQLPVSLTRIAHWVLTRPPLTLFSVENNVDNPCFGICGNKSPVRTSEKVVNNYACYTALDSSIK